MGLEDAESIAAGEESLFSPCVGDVGAVAGEVRRESGSLSGAGVGAELRVEFALECSLRGMSLGGRDAGVGDLESWCGADN
jgi:hypothetical protein